MFFRQARLRHASNVDYLERVLAPGAVFSVPNVASADAILALAGTVLRAAEASLHDVAAGMRFMKLVEGKLRRRKVPRTEAALARQSMLPCVSAGVRGSGTRG